MSTIKIKIDGNEVTTLEGTSVLRAAQGANIYIPTLCSHPDLPPAGVCNLCIVDVRGELVNSCETIAVDGMVVNTNTPAVQKQRRDNLAKILATHPHACLTCAQREGCSRTQCSSNVPVNERCCVKFGNCEIQAVSDYIGIKPDTPRFIHPGKPVYKDDPLFDRDYNLCIACARCVRVCKEVRGVGAIAVAEENGIRSIVMTGPSLRESACRFCTACVEVCPTGTLLDKGISRKLTPEEKVPCRTGCPAGIDIPRYVRFIANGQFDESLAVIREKVPFPSVLGHVCFHPCETACRRTQVTQPIAICDLKRFASETGEDLWKKNSKHAPSTGKKVAIIGSGPAGLTAAFYLAKAGHSVTIFEALPELGGMMRVGIPAYRLPTEVLRRDLDFILELNIEVKTNTAVGKDISFDDLKAKGFDAILISVGASQSRRIPLEGSDLDGVLWGVDFLRDVRLGRDVKVGDRVVVIGGGNVAIDVAMTALRAGAKEVKLACLESRPEMPAFVWEIAEAEEEGVAINNSWGPKRVLGNAGKVKGIEMVRCTAVFDAQGRFNPSFDESVTTSFDADTIILAIGQASDLSFLNDGSKIELGRGTIKVNDQMMTSAAGIFASGEVVKAPGTVIEAVAAGRRAASAIDKYLGGTGDIDEVLASTEQASPYLGREEGFADRQRVPMPTLSGEERRCNFSLIKLGYEREMAIAEAKRCLQCDLRLQIGEPIFPPDEWLEFNEANVSAIPAEVDGVYQLLDENKEVIKIKGTQNLREALQEQLESNKKAKYFHWEEDMMYTKRESELISMYLQEHGKMPEGGDDLDDLF